MHAADRLLSERISGNKAWAVGSGARLAEHRRAARWKAASLRGAAVVTRSGHEGLHAISCHYNVRLLSPEPRILKRLKPMLYRGMDRAQLDAAYDRSNS